MPANGKGDVVRLNNALLDYMRAYTPSPEGVCYLHDQMAITLPLPEWAWYAWFETLTANLTAGQGTDETVFTVPGDERIYLDGIVAVRTGGDNNIDGLTVAYPTGYFAGAAVATIIAVTATTIVFWPDPGGLQTTTYVQGNPPLLLEPGSVIAISPDGSGVSASTVLLQISMRRTKIVRALVPYP